MTPPQSPIRNGLVMDSRRVGRRLFGLETACSAGLSATSLGLRSFKRTRLFEEAPHRGRAQARGASSGMWDNGAACGASHSICGLSLREMPSARRGDISGRVGPASPESANGASRTLIGDTTGAPPARLCRSGERCTVNAHAFLRLPPPRWAFSSLGPCPHQGSFPEIRLP
jgi:hypothetical protein